MSTHSVDALLATANLPQPTEPVIAPVAPMENIGAVDANEEIEISHHQEPEKLNHLDQFRKDKEESLAKKSEETQENVEKTPEKKENIDDYGNEVPKERMYTESELQQRIRDRLREKHNPPAQPQPTQQQVQQAAADGFEPDANSGETWQEQLGSFMDKHLETRTKKAQEREWKSQEDQRQAEFEVKFNAGIEKFKDFGDVTRGKPMTDGMLLATRAMQDPAAFIYAAAKNHTKELERIASIPDTIQQATEIGKLEERMRKTKNISSAPKPIKKVVGDVGGKAEQAQPSLDDLIRQDAQRKLRR